MGHLLSWTKKEIYGSLGKSMKMVMLEKEEYGDGISFKNFGPVDGMGDYGVWCMLEDREGNIWFGTRNMGLYRFDGKTFTSFSE